MSSAELFVVVVIALPLILVATNLIRMDVAGILTALFLAAAQCLGIGVLGAPGNSESATRALIGLGQPVTITLFSLIVITRCLERTGVARWLSRKILALGGNSEGQLIAILAAASATLSLFMNNLAAGALVLPSAMEVSRRTSINASKLLLPVAYGACLGGTATYFTTANIIASDMLRAASPTQQPLGFFDFTAVGALITLVGIGFLRFFGPQLLPNRDPSAEQQVARRTGSELEAAYDINSGLWEAHINKSSPHVGEQLHHARIGERLGVTVLAVIRGKHVHFAPPVGLILHAGDHLLIVGSDDRVKSLSEEGFHLSRSDGQSRLSAAGALFVEMVLVPESPAEGKTLKEIKFRSRYGLTAVAVRRDGQSYRTDVADMVLKQGDSILAVGGDDRFKVLQQSRNFLLLETDHSDKPTDWPAASVVIALTAFAIISSVCGLPVYLGALAAAVLMILFRIIAMDDVYRAMEWQAIIFVAGMYPLSLAMIHTGLAARIGDVVISVVQPFGPLGLIAGSYILTALIAQFIAGQIATLIAAPILISAAITLNVNPQAVAVATAIACSASFLTPLAHPVNALMIGPGNYRFSDFFRAGWPLTILSFVMLLLGMKLFWGI